MNGPGDQVSVLGRVIPKTQKRFLMQSCLTLSIRYESMVKCTKPANGIYLLPLGVDAIKMDPSCHPQLRSPTLHH